MLLLYIFSCEGCISDIDAMIRFNSDYMAGAHPEIMDELLRTNMEHTVGYGNDSYTAEARRLIREAVGCPDAEVFFLVGGTQTNAKAIDGLLARHDGVLAAESGHIAVHESGAIEASGHKVLTLPHRDGKVAAADVERYIEEFYAEDYTQAEIDAIHNEIANGIKSAVAHHSNPDDDLTPRIKASMDMYSDIDRTSEIEELLADMAAKGFKFNGQSLPPDFYNIIKSIYDAFTETPINDKQVDSLLLTIKKSNPTHTTPVIHPVTSKKIVDLHTPEHKGFAVEVIKKFRSEEEDWYRTVYVTLKEFGYDSATIKDIWDKTRGAGNGD